MASAVKSVVQQFVITLVETDSRKESMCNEVQFRQLESFRAHLSLVVYPGPERFGR